MAAALKLLLFFDKKALVRGGGADSNYPFSAQQERDIETGLDYFRARHFSSNQGRFVAADKQFADQFAPEPQTWNLYTYVTNQPLIHTDPLDLWKEVPCSSGQGMCWESDSKKDTITSLANELGVSPKVLNTHFQNPTVHIGDVFDMSGLDVSSSMTVRDEGPAVVQVFLVREETPMEKHQRWLREQERQRIALARFIDRALNPCAYPVPHCYMGIIYLGSGSITFGGSGQMVGHGARHLASLGLQTEIVEAAIIEDIANVQRMTGTTGGWWGK